MLQCSEYMAGQGYHIVADDDDRQAFDRLVQEQLQVGTPVHPPKQVPVLLLDGNADPDTQQTAGP